MSNFKYSLEICSQQNIGTVYQLNRNEIVVGRGNVDISIDNPTLSTSHCLIRNTGAQLTVTDLQSKNGTTVNDQRIIQETILASGDILALGEVVFRVTAAITKERLSSYASPEEAESKSIVKKFLNKLPKKSTLKSPYEVVTRNLLIFLVFLSGLILISPLFYIMQDKVTTAKVERAVSLVTALAAANTDAMRQNRQILVDTAIIDKEVGVQLAIILTNQGVAWAPDSIINKKVGDIFGKKATDTEQLLIQDRGNNIIDVSLPIKYYDFNNGQTTKLGVARILYDIDPPGSGPNFTWIVLLCLGVYFIITILCIRKINLTVKTDIITFQEDCEDVIKGNILFLEEKYSPVFNNLTVTINRMLRKLSQPKEAQQTSNTEDNQKQLIEMVSHLDQPALLVNEMNIVMGSSMKAHNLLAVQPEYINFKSMLEIHCEKDFYSQLLEFACEATQISTKTTKTASSKVHGNIQFTALPIATGYSLILLVEEAYAMA